MLYHVRDLESSMMTYFRQLDASGLMIITLASKRELFLESGMVLGYV